MTQYQFPPLSAGGQLSAPHFEKGGSEKNERLGGLKEFLPLIFALEGGAYYVSCQKKTFKSTIWL